MNKITVSLLPLFLILFSCANINKLYVVYGEQERLHRSESAPLRIYFDRKGFIYPAADINDVTLRARDSRLESLYQNDQALYHRLCAQYNATPYAGDWKLIQAYNDPLQERLVSGYVASINNRTKAKKPVFIIHGFNEHPSKPNNQKSCFAENRITADSVRSIFPSSAFEFIEVYWDGLSAENVDGFKGFNTAKIWNNAQASATFAGLELRRILSKLDAKEIYVITHSHGAAVITTALFNVIKFKTKYYDERGHWLQDIYHNRYPSAVYNTPGQQFHVGMLAPAIPGVNVFDEYAARTINGSIQSTSLMNYHFVVGFNANDPVTSKGKILAGKVGSTTLGSRRKELRNTRLLFENDFTVMDYVDFSRFRNGDRQVKHGWLAYMYNQPFFTEFLKKTFPASK